MAIVVQNKSNQMPTVASVRAKVVNNPMSTVVSGGLTYYALTKYTPIGNIWLKLGISVVGAISGAYLVSSLKRNY